MANCSLSYSSACLHLKWADKHRKSYVICLLITAFILNALVGSIYTYGNIQPYLVSYIRQKSLPSSLRYTKSTYLYSSQYAGFAVGIALGGFSDTMLGARMSILLGGTLSSLGMFISYFTIQYSFWLLFISFGFMYSVGVGMIYFVNIASASKWVHQRIGVAVGFVIGGVALGSLSFGSLQTAFINRHNDFPDNKPYETNSNERYFTQTDLIERVPLIFLIQGVIFMLVTFISLPFIANPLVHGSTAEQNTTLTEKVIKFLRRLKTVIMNMLCSWLFYLQWSVALLNILVFGVIASLYKTYGIEELKLSDYFLTALGAVASGVFSFIGRILFGILADKLGYKTAYVLQSGFMAIFFLTVYVTSLGYPIMYFVWVCGMFLCYGGHCTLVTIAVLKGFGSKDFNIHNAMIVTTSQIIASFLYGIVSDFSVDYLGWSGTFLLLGCLAIVQTCLIVLFRETTLSDRTTAAAQTKYNFWDILYLLS